MQFIYSLVFSFLQLAIIIFTAIYEIMLIVCILKLSKQRRLIAAIKIPLGILIIIAAASTSSIWIILLLMLAVNGLIFIFL